MLSTWVFERPTFPHTESDFLTLDFSTSDLQDRADESWGLDNLRVSEGDDDDNGCIGDDDDDDDDG